MIDYDALRANFEKKWNMSIDEVGDGLGKRIEEGIKPLVLVLNGLGYYTSMSCEGHSLSYWKERIARNTTKPREICKEEEYRLLVREVNLPQRVDKFTSSPWVDVITLGDIKKLQKVISVYNANHKIEWHVPFFLNGFTHDFIRFEADWRHPYEKLKASSLELAEWLYNDSGLQEGFER